ncbi:MAG TPA: hypothetical protein VMJ10_32225 [Kofleriaceae bacterium]|nr:hypothetical protein [Kofleriaceae bacterium]
MSRPAFFAASVVAACHSPARTQASDGAVDAGGDAPPPAVTITATVDSTRFVVREHMLAAGEMQISGEPLAQAMSRNLANYSRDQIPPDLYFDPISDFAWIDLAGFSTAIESYEYSKQPMNDLAFESGAGTALASAPLVAGDAQLVALVQHFAAGSNALGKWVFPAGTFPANNGLGDANPNGAGVPANNPLGWPGIWPTAHVFASFDPAIAPTSAVDLACSITSDDNPGAMGAPLVSSDFECDATTLHLPARAAQIDPTITPGADGFSLWKYGLWTLNYLQIMHDANGDAVASVPASALAQVGVPGNAIIGANATGSPTAPGTYLGSSEIEGFQAQLFIQIGDSRAADWLANLTTSDGATLTGFASVAAALAYGYGSPLRWFPGRIAVTETATGGLFPQPAYALASADSSLLDLAGLALGYAELYALTDTRNAAVGGSQPARAFFDGDPFPADDQLADGEATLHDRALAMLRVAVIDLDRLHADPASGVLVDDVAFAGATPARGTTVATTSVAYALLALRTVRRALSSQLELYSNNTPDTVGVASPLDALPIAYPGDATLTFGGRLDQLVAGQAALLYDHLTDASGRAWSGWDVAANAPVDATDTLDAHTAAIRGLFAAYLATGDTRYRDRALAVFDRMQATFYDDAARVYSATPAPVDSVQYTPLRFALLQSALRDVYELVATRPGGDALEPILEERIARLDKLVLNGWDDRNRDKHVDWPGECMNVVAGLPRGGLQMAERTLSGELGRMNYSGSGSAGPPTTDREQDCVPAIDAAQLPAALADSITLWIARS